ncbi:MAG TPA: LPS export ABC transporter periplasmic protein LptC [Bryobacteraceae bacterium]|nr:LPS export ABC transporter periplasmic protein LptC [Bryobacteraceae bacterium]
MRRVGPLIVVLMMCILGGVGSSYYRRLREQASHAASKPKQLPPNIRSVASDWEYTKTEGQTPIVYIRAKDMEEVENKYRLTGVELHLFHKDGDEYDLVKSAKAEFDINQGILYSEGKVEITMGVPKDEEPSGRLMSIQSSGVHFESKTGKASTDRLVEFHFDRGRGHALGADYDPGTRELHLRDQVELVSTGDGAPDTKPMTVQTKECTYKEKESKVFLSPWSKFSRDTLALNAGPAEVTLDEGDIKFVETVDAQGTDNRPNRKIEYSAAQLLMDFAEGSQVRKITGIQNAKLISGMETTVTTITSDKVEMDFDTSQGDSTLKVAVATGHAVAESKPIPKPGTDTPETRILRSDVIAMAMRPGGQEIEHVETQSAGALEFLPNQPRQPHRWMNGERIWMVYGPKNTLETARSVNVTTRTENPKEPDANTAPPPSLTSSKNLLATFQPNSSQLAKLEQWDQFKYEQGERHARAERAILDQPKNIITLVNHARVWDGTGSTDATTIIMDQKSGDIDAEGNVDSTRMPDKKDDDTNGSSSMLSSDEPMHARSKKMITTNKNQHIKYEGTAVLWQGANRLQGDLVEIDREKSTLTANGHVVSQLVDKSKDSDSKDSVKDQAASKSATKPSAPVFTIVKAPELFYDDDQRLAHYKGGAALSRPNMQVKAQEIRAFLRDDSDDSSLDHAFADGKVEILQTAPDRTRNGGSEHAEYYVDDDKVILEGGSPHFADSVRGNTKGAKLTWFSKDNRLLVNGVEKEPAKSVLRKKNAPQ